MNIIIRSMFAAAVGALVAISLGKHVSSNSLALLLWGIVGAFVGFVSAGPKEFGAALHKVWLTVKQGMDVLGEEMDKKLRANAARDEELKELYAAARSEDRWFALSFALTTEWYAAALATLALWRVPELDILTFFGWGIISCIFLPVFSLLMAFSSRTSLRNRFSNVGYGKIRQETRKKISAALEYKAAACRAVILPLWLTWWFVSNLGRLAFGAALILAKLCAVLAKDGWAHARSSAAIGALIGYIVGWSSGRSELVAMGAGALAGGGVLVLASAMLTILPNADQQFPKFTT